MEDSPQSAALLSATHPANTSNLSFAHSLSVIPFPGNDFSAKKFLTAARVFAFSPARMAARRRTCILYSVKEALSCDMTDLHLVRIQWHAKLNSRNSQAKDVLVVGILSLEIC